MPRKILVVDDSVVARRQVVDAIKEGDFEFVEANNGDEGLLRFKSDASFVLVISDVNMPVMDGIDMVAAIRKLGLNAHVPVLMVTTESTPDQINRGKAAGVTGWLVKPFNPHHLQAAIKKALGR